MTSLTIELPDQQIQQLQQLAQSSGISPEQLLQTKIDHWLTQSDHNFTKAANYVLQKNAELYQSLASGELDRNNFTQWLQTHTKPLKNQF